MMDFNEAEKQIEKKLLAKEEPYYMTQHDIAMGRIFWLLCCAESMKEMLEHRQRFSELEETMLDISNSVSDMQANTAMVDPVGKLLRNLSKAGQKP